MEDLEARWRAIAYAGPKEKAAEGKCLVARPVVCRRDVARLIQRVRLRDGQAQLSTAVGRKAEAEAEPVGRIQSRPWGPGWSWSFVRAGRSGTLASVGMRG